MTTKKILTIEFPAEAESDSAIRRTLNADSCYSAIWDIAQEVFRPARKHGYSDQAIQAELDKAGEVGSEIVHLLEKKFYEILERSGVSLEDWQ